MSHSAVQQAQLKFMRFSGSFGHICVRGLGRHTICSDRTYCKREKKKERERGRGRDRFVAICPAEAFNIIVSSRYLKLHLAWTLMHDSECLNPGYVPVLIYTFVYGLPTALTPKQSVGCNGNGNLQLQIFIKKTLFIHK